MAKRDYYEVLGVDRKADAEAVRKAYKRMAMRHHPDRNPGDAAAEGRFKELGEAYKVLSDPQKRAAYDRFGHAAFDAGGMGGFQFGGRRGGGGGEGPPDLSSIFGEIFEDFFNGGGGRSGSRARDSAGARRIILDLSLSFEEAALGCSRRVRVTLPERCGACRGSCAEPGSHPKRCGKCGGGGHLRVQRGFFSAMQTCPDCHGRGEVVEKPCKACGGRGDVERTRSVALDVPAGVDDGEALKMRLEGGELLLRVHVSPHELFERRDGDLILRMPVSFATAALGGEVQAPKLGGGRLAVRIPAGSQSGQVFRLRGEGIERRGRGRGDMLCFISVETPVNLNREQREALRRFQQSLEKTQTASPKRASWLEKARAFLGD